MCNTVLQPRVQTLYIAWSCRRLSLISRLAGLWVPPHRNECALGMAAPTHMLDYRLPVLQICFERATTLANNHSSTQGRDLTQLDRKHTCVPGPMRIIWFGKGMPPAFSPGGPRFILLDSVRSKATHFLW